VLAEIFMILSVGLVTDMISTWFGNAGILKWYCIKKGIK
jgi:preprotein translocase subunit SecF